jgi:tetratricopeptide (TPR) repeat protein
MTFDGFASTLRVAIVALAAAIPATLPAQSDAAAGLDRHVHSAGEKLGAVSFPNSGARAAQSDFLRGLALLHNFEYDAASRALRAAEQRDPSFAMAYWLDALTFSHMLWSEEDLPKARATLARLAATPASRLVRAKTPRELAYGAAVEAFFADADESTRAHAFADSMRAVAAAYPKDFEAQAFASLAIMLAAENTNALGEANRLYLSAASYAERVFRAQPNHPGAAHYLIHAYDAPSRAAKGLSAARAYARIAPSAEHAQHMPSHIFVQLGLWDDAVHSNEKAWASSRSRVAAEHGPASDLDFHTLNWLAYSYLQQGRYRAARALVDTARLVLARADLTGVDQPDARYAVSQLQFKYMRETGDWNAWPVVDFDTTELHLPPTATFRAQSMAASHVLETAIVLAMRGDTVPVSFVARRTREQVARRGAKASPGERVRAAVLDAVLARAREDVDAAISLLSNAEAAADSVPPVGPVNLLPVHELLGAMLFDEGRYARATVAYRRALTFAPNRSAALLGLARSEQRSKNASASEQAYARLKANWSRADPALLRQIAARNDR